MKTKVSNYKFSELSDTADRIRRHNNQISVQNSTQISVHQVQVGSPAFL